MLAELVECQTPDSARLHGAFFRATSPCSVGIDGAIILHGLAGNFYSSQLLTSVTQQLLELGISVVLANTRGHDGLNWTSIDVRTIPQGAAFEIVDDCRQDIRGWVEFLSNRDCHRIALVGHSLGAIKVIYAQTHQPNSEVVGVAALSASRLNYQRFLASSSAPRFQHWMDEAKRLVAAGQGSNLMQVDFPFPAFMAAEAYLNKYGPEDRYDWISFASRINCPLLATFGERELTQIDAFSGIVADVEQLQREGVSVECQVIPGANHFYMGRREAVSSAVRDWMVRHFPPVPRD